MLINININRQPSLFTTLCSRFFFIFSTFRVVYLLIGLFSAFLLTSCQNDSRPENTPPKWSETAVWYQIFPDRFYNGDTANDPTLSELAGGWPHDYQGENWKPSRWTGDFYERQAWEKGNPEKSLGYFIQTRRYGGDIQGIISKLDYLKNLGITAIYLNPMFESPSLHKYDGSTYHHIDNNFGPDPARDIEIWNTEIPDDPSTWKMTTADSLFFVLVREVHNREMKIIIDGVFNHVGNTFWAIKDIQKNGKNSKFTDWFTILSWDDPATPENELKWQGWLNVYELPEIREDSLGIVAGPKSYIFNSVKKWMDPNGDGNPEDGIDGWRLDVAEKVATPFWQDFRKQVKSINPEAYITAEIFWDNWAENKMVNPKPYFNAGTFDGIMNYPWAALAFNFFADKKLSISSDQFWTGLDSVRKNCPANFVYSVQNLYDSHDVDRLSSSIANPDRWFDHYCSGMDDSTYKLTKPSKADFHLLKLMALFQMTDISSPMIYYGTEAGMWGCDDPEDRKPMVWPELTYQPEQADPWGRKRSPDSVSFDYDLFSWYKNLIFIRKTTPALNHGTTERISLISHNPKVLAFKRMEKGQSVFVLINANQDPVSVEFEAKKTKGSLQSLLNTMKYPVTDGKVKIPVSGVSGDILIWNE